MINAKVIIDKLCMIGNEPTLGDKKYISKALNQVVTIKYKFENNLYLTDFFMPEYINDNNDYCYYGFLLVSKYNIATLNK